MRDVTSDEMGAPSKAIGLMPVPLGDDESPARKAGERYVEDSVTSSEGAETLGERAAEISDVWQLYRWSMAKPAKFDESSGRKDEDVGDIVGRCCRGCGDDAREAARQSVGRHPRWRR
jgi:hypothetical protein